MAIKPGTINYAMRNLAFVQLNGLPGPVVEVSGSAQPRVGHVVGPKGRHLTLADLPSPDTKRWVIRRKAEVIAALRGGLLSLEEACSRYALNPDEVLSWQHCIDRFGLNGLRTTWTQYYLRNCARPESLELVASRRAGECSGKDRNQS
jgi:Protein of unknown function (DUF1153)